MEQERAIPPTSPFALALCQAGAEPWLKRELARVRPDLRPSYQRPGLLTLRCDGTPCSPDEAPDLVFARLWACSHGLVRAPGELLELAARVGATRLWLAPREQGPPERTPPARQEAAEAHADALRAELAPHFTEGPPAVGDTVLDVLTSPDDPPVAGWHTHGPGRHPGPAGRYGLVPPPEAPSRAWAKVGEALAGSGARIGPGDTVLEIGAAPGGGTLALLERGARVIAVDPQPMDPRLVGHERLLVVPRAIGDVRWEDLPLRGVTWIACDAHIPPVRALHAVRRMVTPVRATLRGLLVTFKLYDAATVEQIPRLLEQLGELGATAIWARQLPSNRQDFTVVARMGRAAQRPGAPTATR